MKNFVLDSNILIHIIRNSHVWQYVKENHNPFSFNSQSFISVVTVGEVKSFAHQNKWGRNREEKLDSLIRELRPYKIFHQSIIDAYVEIDAYSQGNHASKKLPQYTSARNMGKNDLWIAATASVFGATLISTDNDFVHLHEKFIDFVYVDVNSIIN